MLNKIIRNGEYNCGLWKRENAAWRRDLWVRHEEFEESIIVAFSKNFLDSKILLYNKDPNYILNLKMKFSNNGDIDLLRPRKWCFQSGPSNQLNYIPSVEGEGSPDSLTHALWNNNFFKCKKFFFPFLSYTEENIFETLC